MSRYSSFTDDELRRMVDDYTIGGFARKVDDIIEEIRIRSGASDTTLAIDAEFRLIVRTPKKPQERYVLPWKL